MKFIRKNIFFRFLLLAIIIQNFNSLEASSISELNIIVVNGAKANLKIESYFKIDVEKPAPEKKEQSQNNSFDFTGEDNIEWLHLYLPTAFNLCFAPLDSRFFFFYKEKYSEQFHADIIPPPPKA